VITIPRRMSVAFSSMVVCVSLQVGFPGSTVVQSLFEKSGVPDSDPLTGNSERPGKARAQAREPTDERPDTLRNVLAARGFG